MWVKTTFSTPSDTRPEMTKYFPINRLLSLTSICMICISNLSKNQSKSGSFQRAEDPGLEVVFTKIYFEFTEGYGITITRSKQVETGRIKHAESPSCWWWTTLCGQDTGSSWTTWLSLFSELTTSNNDFRTISERSQDLQLNRDFLLKKASKSLCFSTRSCKLHRFELSFNLWCVRGGSFRSCLNKQMCF